MKPEEKKRTLADYLIEKIKKSGYPLEIEISNVLDERRYVVFNTQYYFDEETKQGRDIDIYAMPLESYPSEEKLALFNVRTEVAIECKKSETHAWIFYTRPSIPASWIYMSGQYHISVPEPKEFVAESFDWLLKQKILILHYNMFKRIAIAYDEIKKKDGSSKREIFEAINQLVKFTCYEIHQIFDRISKLPKTSYHQEREHLIIFFPIIVFDGDMFEVNLDSGEPILKRKNHILLVTHYRCPYRQEVKSFAIDVVHRSYFSKFMEILKASCYQVREMMLQNYDELVEKAREARIKCETTEGTFG